MSEYLHSMFQDLRAVAWPVWLSLAVLVALAVWLLAAGRHDGNRFTVRTLAFGAICLAISFLLSCIKLFEMPQGGSITPCSMLPLIAFAYYTGTWQGAVVGVAFGLLQMMNGGYILNPIQGALDYPVAFAVLALGAFLRKANWKSDRVRLALAIVIGCAARWLVHTLGGMVFFAEYAGDQNVFVYSAVYNAFLFVEAGVCIVISLIPGFDRAFQRLKAK